MGGTDNLIETPAVAIGIFPLPVLLGHDTVITGEGVYHLVKEFKPIQKMTHTKLSLLSFFMCFFSYYLK